MTDDTDVKVIELLAPLSRLETVAFAASERSGHRWLRNPVLVGAVVTVALVLAGVAIAAGFGGFSGFGATQHPPTRADVLPAKTLAEIKTACSGGPPLPASLYNPYCHLDLNTARFLTDTGPGGKVWVVADSRGEFCTVGGFWDCQPPFSRSRPITFGSSNEAPTDGGTFYAAGLAMDGVTSVSFVPVPGNGKTVTAPVKGNIWVYKQPNSRADNGHCIVAHFADGSSVVPAWPGKVPCP
jgi:hypothetical protein